MYARWLIRPRRRTVPPGGGGAPVRVVCWPHAGAPATAYLGLAEELPDWDVIGVQPPGRQERFGEPPVRDPATAVEYVTSALRQLPRAGRLVLLGHSLGALMAHRLALRLEELGERVDLLAVSGRHAPDHTHGRPLGGASAKSLTEDELMAFLDHLDAPEREFLQDPDIRAYALPLLHDDLVLGDAVASSPAAHPVRAPLLTLSTDDDPMVPAADMSAWSTAGEVRGHLTLPGRHFALFDHPRTVAGSLRQQLPDPAPAHPAPATTPPTTPSQARDKELR